MSKRGQITIFIILGIVILAVVALTVYLLQPGLFANSFQLFQGGSFNLKNEVNKCIVETISLPIDQIGKQGGTLSPKKSVLYLGSEVNYLCYNQVNRNTCINRVLRLQDMENELEEFLSDRVKSCIDTKFANLEVNGASIQTQEYELDVTIAEDTVLILVDYPSTINYKGITTTADKYVQVIDVPLGKLYQAVFDIVNSESLLGDFDPLPYMIIHKDIQIKKNRPYPDKLYILNEVNDPYIFQFAIEGELR